MKKFNIAINIPIFILILIIGLYLLYLLHLFGILYFKQRDGFDQDDDIPLIFDDDDINKVQSDDTCNNLKNNNLTGPYESCEDSVCKSCQYLQTYEQKMNCKKKCMCDKRKDIMDCCKASCPPGNSYCIEACTPLFDTCESSQKSYDQNLKGPYENCEDSVCQYCMNLQSYDEKFKCKKDCMCYQKYDIKNCCTASCPPGNSYCLEACIPSTNACD